MPANAHWLDSYALELTTFPRGEFEDQVDSTSQALGWLATDGRETGILGYHRRLAKAEANMANGMG